MLEKLGKGIFGKKGCLEKVAIPAALVLIIAVAIMSLSHKNGSIVNATDTPLPERLPTSTLPASLPTSITGLNNNCTVIQPGETTWGAAQRIGDKNTIWDFDYYQVTKNDQQIGIIKPSTWDVSTSTDEQQRLRADNQGAEVCAFDN